LDENVIALELTTEENNPVIIEYKRIESSELVNQSLYYLSWIKDHKGDFQIAVNIVFRIRKFLIKFIP